MADAPTEQNHSKRGQVTIAIIGLLGILVTGTLSNWDKLFPKQNLIQATYSGYRPTGNFETEVRYYFEVSGTRQDVESMQRQLLLSQKAALLSEHPNDAEMITNVINAAEKEAPKLDDVIRELLPVFHKHYTLAEIQELNKFYSTDIMQGMAKKDPLFNQDAAPIQVKMMNDFIKRFTARLTEALKSQAAPPDSEATKLLVGSWVVPTDQYTATSKDQVFTFKPDGTFSSYAVLRIHDDELRIDVKGKWSVKDGVLIEELTKSSQPQIARVGLVTHDTLLAVTDKEYRFRTEQGTEHTYVRK